MRRESKARSGDGETTSDGTTTNCFACAPVNATGELLPFKGDGFGRTDIVAA